ncbi:AAA family ATPase [Flammeovirga sp. OC4]|uniref:AAA family ATPase n=1 Tax=Flammeovirga sp. OC4 TaxID=1382345 RepID=UPI0006946EEF|nr:AAA family ATPase [Flammeovirga sp. OC4]
MEDFKKWLTKKHPDSGTTHSYMRAIEILNDYFQKNLYSFEVEELELLLIDVKAKQKEEEGAFYNSKSTSYGKKGYYSAAITSFIDFLKNYNREKKYWLYAPGEGAKKWEEFYSNEIIGLGWDQIGDLHNYPSKEALQEIIMKTYEGDNPFNQVLANWDFYQNMNIGDIVIAKNGRKELIGYGEVISEYFYDSSRLDYQKCRKVKWLRKGNWKVDFNLVLKTLTDVTTYKSGLYPGEKYYDVLLKIMNGELIQKQLDKTYLPKNQILFGPPGTGKTYNTINKALEIIDGSSPLNRNDAKIRYDELIKSGNIVFTTFHQSMSYEDFVEGIKPLTKGDDLRYEITDGIFKMICSEAQSEFNSYTNNSTFKQAFSCLVSEWEESDTDLVKVNTSSNSSYFELYDLSTSTIRFRKKNGSEKHTLSKKTLERFYNNEASDFKGGLNVYYKPLSDKLKSYQIDNKNKSTNGTYILIIDEINRGNVSAIFGELITLLEESKRIGEEEELKVTLPYSKEEFGVPNNLYIIGTMNTADRSVEALDTALRRRFVFEEIMPNYDVLNERNVQVGETIFSLRRILEVINKRITILLDRDHQIGHSYFIKVTDEHSLKLAFAKEIIPLLQEYFYNDYVKIALVLGTGFCVKVETSDYSNLLASIDDSEITDLYSNQTVYQLKDINKIDNFESALNILLKKE